MNIVMDLPLPLSITQAIINFHFVRPLWFLALIPLIVIACLLWYGKGDQGRWQKVIPNHLLPFLLVGKNVQQAKQPIILISLTWILSVIALSGPAWRQLPQPVEMRIDAQVILLDLSQSMNAKDITPNRLSRAKYKLSDLMAKREEGVTGLVVYAGNAHVVIPLTADAKTIDSLIPSLDPNIMPTLGSNPIAALEQALGMLERGKHSSAKIILLTDGIKDTQAKEMVALVTNSQITLSILGIGTEDGGPIPLANGSYMRDKSGAIVITKLNRKPLQKMAQQLGGNYAEITADNSDINALLATNILPNSEDFLNEKTKETTRQFDAWEEDGFWLIALILPLASLAFRRGWLGCILAGFLISVPTPSKAGVWEDLWQTRDQQGRSAMNRNQAPEAADLFRSSTWKAVAQYKSGQYHKAEKGFLENKKNSDNEKRIDNEGSLEKTGLSLSNMHYNRGNSLAHLGKYEDAIEEYKQSLELDQNNVDAKFNMTLVNGIIQKEDDSGLEPGDENGDGPLDKKFKDPDSSESTPEDQAPTESAQNQNPGSDPAQQEPGQQEQDPSQNKKKTQLVNEELTPKELQDLEQWLRQVDEDPGGLMRRKFALQAKELELEDAPTGERW